jgi:hypothetical protein
VVNNPWDVPPRAERSEFRGEKKPGRNKMKINKEQGKIAGKKGNVRL